MLQMGLEILVTFDVKISYQELSINIQKVAQAEWWLTLLSVQVPFYPGAHSLFCARCKKHVTLSSDGEQSQTSSVGAGLKVAQTTGSR